MTTVINVEVEKMETHSYTVLVVDNNPLDRTSICASLTDQGYTVVEAEGGQQALEMLHRRQSVDAVLVDLVMPGMDGFQVLSRMKADGVLHSIPVIVVSAADDMESVLRCVEMGAVAHLSKPVDAEVLQSQVRATLAGKQEQEAEGQRRSLPAMARTSWKKKEDQEDEEDGASLAEFGRCLLSFTEPYWKWRQIPLILFIHGRLRWDRGGSPPLEHLIHHGPRPASPRPANAHSDPGGGCWPPP